MVVRSDIVLRIFFLEGNCWFFFEEVWRVMMVVVAFYGLNRNIRSKKYLFYLLYLCVLICVWELLTSYLR